MVKPQFEVGKERVGSGGVVRDPALRAEAVLDVADGGRGLGLGVAGVAASPLPGPVGQRRVLRLVPPRRPARRTGAGDQRRSCTQVCRIRVARMTRAALLVTHTGRQDTTAHARTVARDLIEAGFEVRVVAEEAADLDLPGVTPVRGAGARPRASRSSSRSAATAPCCARPSWPGRPRRRCSASTSGKVGFLAEAEIDDLDQAVRDVVARAYTVDERLTLDVTAELRRRGDRRVLGAQRGQRREGRAASGCSSCWSTWTAGRCRGTAATAWSAPPRPARRRTRSRPAARWCGREVEALLLVPISAHALFSRPLVTAPTSTIDDHRGPVHVARGAVLRRPARLRPAAGRAGHGAARASCRCGWCGCVRGRSPTGWWPSSGCRWRAGAGNRPVTAVAPRSRRGWATVGRAATVCAVLEELRITGLGVIDDTTLPLTRGMNVITGETGAGKTMVVTGLGLLFGGRADAGRVRADPGRAVVEGRLRLAGARGRRGAARASPTPAPSPTTTARVLLSRTVTVEGRSRAHVGGRAVPVSLLGEVGEQVVAVHGQSDQLRLLRPAEQRAALDRFAGPEHEKLLVDVPRGVRRAGARSPTTWPTGGATRASAHQEADLLRLGPRRDHPGRPAARRGRRAARRGAAAGARRGAAHRGAARVPGARRRRRGRRRAGRDQPARHRPAHAGGAVRGGPGAGRAGRPAGGGGHAGRRRRRRAVGLPGAARRRPGPAAGRSTSGGPRCAR